MKKKKMGKTNIATQRENYTEHIHLKCHTLYILNNLKHINDHN